MADNRERVAMPESSSRVRAFLFAPFKAIPVAVAATVALVLAYGCKNGWPAVIEVFGSGRALSVTVTTFATMATAGLWISEWQTWRDR
jgi:hypothetical protein